MNTKTYIIIVVAKLFPEATAATIRGELADLEGRNVPRSLAEIVARLSRMEKEGILWSQKAAAGSGYRTGTKIYQVTEEGQQTLVEMVKQADEIREIPSLAASLATA